MRNYSFAKFSGLVLAALLCACSLSFAAESNDPNIPQKLNKTTTVEQPRRPRLRINSVKMANFYLRDGQLVFGKVITEDKSKITIEQLDDSRLIVNTYSRREIDTRTLRTKKVPEHKYYVELAEYFTGKTWDFQSDPDDFIHAIRSYEKAKQSLSRTYDPNSERIKAVDTQIAKLQADREVWTREARSRAELMDLEFQATIATRLKELEENVNNNMLRISRILEKLDAIAGDLQADNIDSSQRNQDTARELGRLQERVDNNRRTINQTSRRRNSNRRFYTKQQIKNK